MCQSLVVVFLVGKSCWKFSGCDGERYLICGVAFSENDQADIVPEKAIEQWHEDFETLFLNDASHHPEDWAARRRREVHFFQ